MNNENLLTEFNAGGSHEANPFGGIQQGIGANGKPNLVEEGETKKGQYIYSDRITLDEASITKHGLPKKLKGKTMAEASKYIAKQYKGDTNNKIDKDTSKEMLDRLTLASEEIKQSINPQPQPQQGQQFEGGGFMDSGWDEMSGADKASGIAGGASTLMDLGMTAFGPTGVDKSGMVDPDRVDRSSQGMMGAQGALKGASAGAAFGPIGAAIGGVVGLGAGLIGGGKAKKEAEQASHNFDMRGANMQNFKADGGFIGVEPIETTRGDLRPMVGGGFDYTPVGANRTPENINPMDELGIQAAQDNGWLMNDKFSKQAIQASNNNTFAKMNPQIDSTGVDNTLKVKGEKDKPNLLENLRYAPAAMNAIQALTLKKPEHESLDRLDSRYKRNYVDEQSMLNKIQRSGNVNEAIANASGGSKGALRSNLLAAHLNKMRATSDAYLSAENINRGEDKTAQQFDLNVDRVNMQQSNSEKDINARNRAAYDNNKSMLLGNIGENLGDIGLEELRKSYPEKMGLGYDWRGRYLAKIEAEKKAKKQNKKG